MAKEKHIINTHPFSSLEEHVKHVEKKYKELFNNKLKKLEELKSTDKN